MKRSILIYSAALIVGPLAAVAFFGMFGPSRVGRPAQCTLDTGASGTLAVPCTVTDSAYYVMVRKWVYVVAWGPYGSAPQPSAVGQGSSPYVLIALPASHFHIIGGQWFRKNISGGDQPS